MQLAIRQLPPCGSLHRPVAPAVVLVGGYNLVGVDRLRLLLVRRAWVLNGKDRFLARPMQATEKNLVPVRRAFMPGTLRPQNQGVLTPEVCLSQLWPKTRFTRDLAFAGPSLFARIGPKIVLLLLA